MPRYEIEFAHDNDNPENPDVKHGWGRVTIQRDTPLETQEDLKGIARTLGLENGWTTVALTKITELDEDEPENVEYRLVGEDDATAD